LPVAAVVLLSMLSGCQQRPANDSSRAAAQTTAAETATEADLARACERRSADACLRLSHYLVLRGAERETVNALLDRACDLGHPGACSAVAEALIGGSRGRTRDVARGAALLERACGGGDGRACRERDDLRAGAP
jgi:TPR repeat protein